MSEALAVSEWRYGGNGSIKITATPHYFAYLTSSDD
jgi:hypothetical protein